MNLIDFIKGYPDEESCKFKQYRDQLGVSCAKCGGDSHYWKRDKEQYECKVCGMLTTLKSGTVMHKSKLSYRYWFIAIHLLTSIKKSFSAKVQHQLGHNRYAPKWHMVHKLRLAMGKRDEQYILAGDIKLDDGFFTSETPQEQQGKHLKRVPVSQKKTKVLVMAESELAEPVIKGQKPRKVGYLKIKVIDDLEKETINEGVQHAISKESALYSDNSISYVDLRGFVRSHRKEVILKEKISEQLLWVHIAISNAKRQLLNSCHSVKPTFLQAFLEEFCYKLDRRYYGEALFGKLLVAAVSSKNEFRYKYR